MQINQAEGYTDVGQSYTKEEKVKSDFPFDLNNLFSMQYSFDQLKMAIEYLAKQQGDQQVLINELLRREPGTTEVRIVEKSKPSSASKSHTSSKKEKVLSSADSAPNTDNYAPLQK